MPPSPEGVFINTP